MILKYTKGNKQKTKKYVVSMDMENRNAIIWDDDRKVSAFVTAKDPAVLELSKNISGWVKHEAPKAVNKNLCIAMVLLNGLKEYGLSYQKILQLHIRIPLPILKVLILYSFQDRHCFIHQVTVMTFQYSIAPCLNH